MEILSLNGEWHLEQVDGTPGSVLASVPGCVHTDLLAAGRIEDPFYRDNEDGLQWIGRSDWVYRRTFQVPEALLRRERVLLRCHGLDTLATVTVNGVQVGTADNMFRTWAFDVRQALRPDTNAIEIRFASAVRHVEQHQAARRIPSWGGRKEPAGRAWLRKEPCNFGWDWGPVLITCGIWRPIELVAFDTARLAEVHVRQDHTTAGQVGLDVAVTAECAAGDPALAAEVELAFAGKPVAAGRTVLAAGQGHVRLVVSDPQLWWPVNLGAQPLYDLRVRLLDGKDRELDADRRRLGLRTLRLDRHPDEWGESFQFTVNGVPFFAKGANWIPADTFQPRMNRAAYERLLRSTAAANMNMLRVWGGGIYEDDLFYELCDELGICVWQEFIFACSTYPAFDDAFLDSVRAEATDNIRRLRHHACLCLWCGNNELEQGLVGDAWTDHQMSWEDYGRLFDKLLPELVQRLDPDHDYWPGSPHTPPPGDRRNFNDPTRGDAHLWDVWHGRKPFEWYRTCTHRFNSEFGFQSFPEPRTVYGYTAPEDRNVTTYVMEHHQRSGIGNTVIMQYMLDWFRLPTAFDMTLWLSQILQGMAMKYAVEHWRRAMPRGMGTLYWQLNDCWPVASWASLDYFGRWKALHHMARDFNAPLLLSGVEDLEKGTVELHITNDRREARHGTLAWHLTDLAGTVVAHDRLSVHAEPGRNTLVTTLDLKAHLAERGPRNLLLWLELTAPGEPVSSNLVLFARPKHLELQPPRLARRVTAGADGALQVTLSARRPALWTWLDLGELDAQCSANFVHIRPGAPVTLTVTPERPLTPEQLKRRLVVRSLLDTYST